MEEIYKELLNLGFIIFQNADKFAVQKVSLPHSPQVLESKEFKTYEEAINFAKSYIAKKNQSYHAIIRYERGLGVEYFSVPNIIANDEDEAKTIALDKSNLLANPKVKVAEVKLRFQN